MTLRQLRSLSTNGARLKGPSLGERGTARPRARGLSKVPAPKASHRSSNRKAAFPKAHQKPREPRTGAPASGRFAREDGPHEQTFTHFSGFGKAKILKSEYAEKKSSHFQLPRTSNLLSPIGNSSGQSLSGRPGRPAQSSGRTFNTKFVETVPGLSKFLQSDQLQPPLAGGGEALAQAWRFRSRQDKLPWLRARGRTRLSRRRGPGARRG